MQHTHESLKAHSRVDDVHGEFLERAVGLAVVLHEDEVPDFDDLRVVLVHQFASGPSVFLLLGRARIHVNLRTGATGTRVAHLPEIIVLRAIDDMVFGHVFQPNFRGFVVAFQPLRGVAFEHGHVEVVGIQLEHVHKVFPRHVDGALLEIVAKRPVAEHLEHGVVVGVVAHLLEVVVLARDAQAFLRVGTAARFGVARTQNDVLPLVHARIGEHERGVVFHHHRGRRHDGVSFFLEKILERLSDFLCCHHNLLHY